MKILILIFGLISLTACSQETNVEEDKKDNQPDSLTLANFNSNNKTDPNEYFSIIDTNFSKYILPVDFKKPKNWKNKSAEKEWYGGEFSDSLNLQDVLKMIDRIDQFGDVCKSKSWCLKNYQRAFPHLIARLSVKEKIGLENTADLIIGCRLNTGDLEFYGHGGAIGEDLFTAAGRVSWILNQITGENFVSVQCDMSKKNAEEYKTLWGQYIKKLEE